MSELAGAVAADALFRSIMRSAFGLRAPEKRESHHLYVIQSSSGEVKIGRAADPRSRVKQLQTGSPRPLRLALVVEGGGGYERAIHARLKDLRIQGEWFEAAALDAVRGMFGVSV